MTNDKTVTMSRELAERLIKGDASKGANALQLADAWKAMGELRAILAAPVVERHADLEKIQVLENTISDLQRDIRKQAHLINIITSEHQTPIVRQEPTAYVLHKNGEVDWDQEVVISNTGGDEQDERFQWLPVFSSPPTPVAVVDLVEAVQELLAGTGNSPGANKRYGKIRACLDKVKEMNQ